MLQVCAGQFKGKQLLLPPESIARPSSNRLRQAIFNILSNYIDFQNKYILDGFAGSGALGIEALSRGAAQVVFCENNPLVQPVLRANILNVSGIKNKASIASDIFQLKAQQPFDVVFLDPPYDKGLEIKAIEYLDRQKLIASSGVIIVEQRKGTQLLEYPNFLSEPPRAYGRCQVTFLVPAR